MFFSRCVVLVLQVIIIFSVSVSCNLFETINAMTEKYNNTEQKTLGNIWKLNDGKQNIAPSVKSSTSFNSVPVPKNAQYSSRQSHNYTSNEKSASSVENESTSRYSKKIRLNLNANNIVGSKRNDLLKRKKRIHSHANDLRQNLRRVHNEQRSLSSAAIDKIKSDIFYGLDFRKALTKVPHKRTSLTRLHPVNDSTPKHANSLHSQLFTKGKTRALNNYQVHDRNIQEHHNNCTEENQWCQSLGTFYENRRRDINVLDYDKVLQNDSTDTPHEDFSTALSDKALYFDNSDNSTHVMKERGMQDKFFNIGSSEKTSQYETGEKKKGALKVIADKLKYVFPFLKGFGLGVKKVLLKPRPQTHIPHQTFKYDSKLGMFYTLSQKSKPPIHPILISSKRPILLSDLLTGNTKTKLKGIPVPYNVEVEKRIPYFIKVPYDNPVPVHIAEPYGVPVEKIVPYPVRVEVPDPYPVTKIVKKPYNLYVENPVPVEVEQPYPVLKEQVKPYTVETVVSKPYIDPVYNDFTVALPYDKNIPYPVTVDNTHEHQNLLNDELESEHLQPSDGNLYYNETILNQSDTGDSEIKPSVQQSSFAYIGAQKLPINHVCNSAHSKPNNEYKTPKYYYADNRLPKKTKISHYKAPTTYAAVINAIMKVKGNGITEVQFLDLMKQSQTRETMKQSQLLHEAFQRALLQRQRMLALIKQNKMLKASLTRDQVKVNPYYKTKEVYPEFKPLKTNFKLPTLQNNKYYFDNNGESYLNQVPEYSHPNTEQQNTNPGTLESYTNYSDKNVPQRTKTQQEIIDGHLRQLYNQNNNNNTEIHVQESDSYSYRLPDSTSLSSYYNQEDSDPAFSMQQNVYNASPNISLQNNDLYRLHLEYKILDNLMKNIDVKKNKSTQSIPTSGYDESLVTKFNTENIQMMKFSPNESIPFVQTPFNNNNIKVTIQSKTKNAHEGNVNIVHENDIQVQTEKYKDSPTTWANLNQLSHIDNYTIYLANVIKDSYLKDHSSQHTEKEKNHESDFENIDVLSGSTIKTTLKPDSTNFEKTINIGNKYKSPNKESDSHSGSLQFDKTKFSNFKDNKKLLQDLFKNGLGTYKPIYNYDGQTSTDYNDDQSSGLKIANFPSKAVPFQVVNNEKHKKTVVFDQDLNNDGADSIDPLFEGNVKHFPSKAVPFQVINNDNHKKAVAFGIDVHQDVNEKKTKNTYDFEIGNKDDSLYDDSTEDYVSWIPQTNTEPVETAKSRTEDEKYENYFGYYKKPIKKWVFNDTDEFKSNSAINFGKLNDFLDIVKHNSPEDDSEAQKKVTAENLKNTIFNDVQKHFDTATDMNAESSYHIESKTPEEPPKLSNNDLAFSDVIFKTKNNSILKNDYFSTQKDTVETEKPVQSALVSTNVPVIVEDKNEKVETFKRRGSTKACKNETLNGIETTISEYSNIRRGKDIVSNKTDSVNEGNVSIVLVKNKDITKISSSSKNDSQNRTQARKGDTHKNSARKVTKEFFSKNGNKLDSNDFLEKVAVITPINTSSNDPTYENHTNHSHQNEPDLQIFDLFNKLDGYISKINQDSTNSEKHSLELTEKLINENSKTILSTTTTSTTQSTTLPSNSKTNVNITKSKPVRGRGSVKASSSILGKNESINVNMKNIPIVKDDSTTESIPIKKRRRQHEKSLTLPDEETKTVISQHFLKNNVKNETKDLSLLSSKGEDIKVKANNTDPVKIKPALFEHSKNLRQFNATHKTYQKDTNEFRTVKIFPIDESAQSKSPVTTSLAPSADRVTVKTVQQIERVKIKNHIKEKIENTTKKTVSKLYDYKNSSDIIERRQKNRERFMFGFMITTPDTPVTEKNA